MKNLTLAFILTFLGLIICVSLPAHELPNLIRHRITQAGTHEYHCPVAYSDSDAERLGIIQETISLPITLQKISKEKGVTFTSYTELDTASLARFFNDQALGWGTVPFWGEIQYLSLPRSPSYQDNFYQIKRRTEETIESYLNTQNQPLENFLTIPRLCEGFRIYMGRSASMTLCINSKSAMCMGHDTYAIRVIDANNQIQWESLDLLGGDLKVAYDYGEDRFDRIYIYQNDHGKITLFTLEYASTDEPQESR